MLLLPLVFVISLKYLTVNFFTVNSVYSTVNSNKLLKTQT